MVKSPCSKSYAICKGPVFESHLRQVEFFSCNMVYPLTNRTSVPTPVPRDYINAISNTYKTTNKKGKIVRWLCPIYQLPMLYVHISYYQRIHPLPNVLCGYKVWRLTFLFSAATFTADCHLADRSFLEANSSSVCFFIRVERASVVLSLSDGSYIYQSVLWLSNMHHKVYVQQCRTHRLIND